MNWNPTENYFLTTQHSSFTVHWWVLVHCGQFWGHSAFLKGLFCWLLTSVWVLQSYQDYNSIFISAYPYINSLSQEHKNPIKTDGQNITLKTKGKAKERPKDTQLVGTKDKGELVPLMVGSYLTYSLSIVVNMQIMRSNSNRRFRTIISYHPIFLSIAEAKARWKAILIRCLKNWMQKYKDKWPLDHLSWKKWAFSDERIHITPRCTVNFHGHWNKMVPFMKPSIFADLYNGVKFHNYTCWLTNDILNHHLLCQINN